MYAQGKELRWLSTHNKDKRTHNGGTKKLPCPLKKIEQGHLKHTASSNCTEEHMLKNQANIRIWPEYTNK